MTLEEVIVGPFDENPKLNSIVHDVEFSDGQVKDHASNVIAENMLTRVDSEGFLLILINSMVD